MTEAVPDYSYSMIGFENDGHWNEVGNMYAAMALFNYLRTTRGETPESLSVLQDRLALYYSCFDRSFAGSPTRVEPPSAMRDRVRARYLSLELSK